MLVLAPVVVPAMVFMTVFVLVSEMMLEVESCSRFSGLCDLGNCRRSRFIFTLNINEIGITSVLISVWCTCMGHTLAKA